VVELKAYELDACSESDSEIDKGNDKGKHIVDVKPCAIISTTNIQKHEPEYREDREWFMHSHMQVKGSLLQFIVDRRRQNNLILVEVMNKLGLPTTPHLQLYTSGWLHQG